MATVTDTLLTIEEYSRLPDRGPTELVRGKVVELNQPYPYHGFVCGRVTILLGNFIEQHDLGRVMSNDAGVITERGPDTLRGADFMYYSYARLPRGPLPQNMYLDVAPDLIVEVRSPSDRRGQVLSKVGEYLTCGVSVVVVIDPKRGTLTVYREDAPHEILAADDEFTLPDLLPGFAAKVRSFLE